MKADDINAVIKKLVAESAGLGRQAAASLHKESIHRFRVSVKTLRSFLRLLQMHAAGKNLKFPRNFKLLYHAAGGIREAQLELEHLSQFYMCLPQYFELLHGTMERYTKQWENQFSEKLLAHLEEELTRHEFKPLHHEFLTDFFRDKMASIAKIAMAETISDDELHKIRKQIKDILNVAKIAARHWPGAHKEIADIHKRQLNTLADAIGAYNDQRIIKEHLAMFCTHAGPAEMETIAAIGHEVAEKLVAEKRYILSQVWEFALKECEGIS